VGLTTEGQLRAEDLVGRIVEGRYKIERIIGKGGMGTVYACRHVVVGKVAAMKVLRAGADHSDGVLQRFVREAQTANLLRSRHIVEVSDFGQLPNGAFFVVMELLEGKDLAHAMRQGLSRKELVHIFTQVAETLQLAHDKGIVHRDLKPDNVYLVNEAGDPLFVKLLDFGIAKILHGESNGGLTETGVILGTPYYMSPEQARADQIDHRTDVYSLGVMMYRAFTGRLPFIADSTMGVLTRHITEEPEPPSKLAQMDRATEALILRAMAKRREERFQTMRDVVEALKRIPTGPVTAAQEHVAALPPPAPQAAAYPGPAMPAQVASQTTGAHAAYAQQSGAYQQPSGAYPQQGAYAQPSGAYAQPSGAYAQPSGAYAQPSGAYAQPSGAYPQQAVPTGSYAATPQVVPPAGALPQASLPSIAGPATSGAFSPATTSGSYASAAASGAFAGAAPAPVDPAAGQPVAGSSETTRGLAATGAMAPVRTGPSTGAIVMGAVAMLSLGALGALLFFRGKPSGGDPPAVTAPATQPAPTTSAAPAATQAPVPSATPAASATPSAEASATPAPSAKPRAGGPATKAAPPPTATAAATATPSKKTPRDIRSPFD
jgi:tRNA A-37 threonylcarbamoyl transferase component Bud32